MTLGTGFGTKGLTDKNLPNDGLLNKLDNNEAALAGSHTPNMLLTMLFLLIVFTRETSIFASCEFSKDCATPFNLDAINDLLIIPFATLHIPFIWKFKCSFFKSGNTVDKMIIDYKTYRPQPFTKELSKNIKDVFEVKPLVIHLESGTLAQEFELSVKAPRFVDKRT